jgi:hypothetical protein
MMPHFLAKNRLAVQPSNHRGESQAKKKRDAKPSKRSTLINVDVK